MIGDPLGDWLNTRGREILDWMYGMVPFMVVAAVAAAVVVYRVMRFFLDSGAAVRAVRPTPTLGGGRRRGGTGPEGASHDEEVDVADGRGQRVSSTSAPSTTDRGHMRKSRGGQRPGRSLRGRTAWLPGRWVGRAAEP